MSRKVKMALSLAFAMPLSTLGVESVRAESAPASVDSSAAASNGQLVNTTNHETRQNHESRSRCTV